MADLNEGPVQYPEGIYQLENGDPITGGVPNIETGAGMDNIPHLMLAQRTAWLKAQIAALTDGLADLDAAVAANTIPAGAFTAGSINQGLPTGLIIKAGQATANSNSGDPEVTITYPVAFPSATVGIAILEMSDTVEQDRAHLISGLQKTRTHFSVVVRSAIDTSLLQTSGFGWIAIGY